MARWTQALTLLVTTALTTLAAQRFDNAVRADFFAGYRGDGPRLARGMETCERALTADPANAAALVWHGGGLFFLSGQKFRDGDWQAGVDLQQRGLQEMDRAVAMRPDDLQTLIPRAATLLAAAPYFPDDRLARPLVEKAIGDYRAVERMQTAGWDDLATHSRGELLGGIAVGYRLLGDREPEAAYLKRIVAELPGTPYASRAAAWLASPASVARGDRFCVGCHE